MLPNLKPKKKKQFKFIAYSSDKCTCTFKADAEHLVTKMKGGVQRGLVLRYSIV